MKSKMKSAFAIIAVALMIMVAVVPMVGVFTSESDATTIVDPEMATTDMITVNVTAKNGAAATVGYAKITYGSYSKVAQLDNGAYSFVLQETAVSLATVTIVDADEVQDANYSPVVITNLVGGKAYNVTLKAGMSVGTATFKFADGTAIGAVSAVKEMLDKGTVTATYDVYSDNSYEGAKKVRSNQFFIFNEDYTASFYYKSGEYIKLTSFTSPLDITFADTAKGAGDTNLNLIAEQKLLTVSPTAPMLKELTVSSITYNDGANSFKKVSDKLLYETETAYFIGTVPTTGSPEFKIKLNDGDTEKDFTANIANDGAVTFTLTGIFAGTVKYSLSSVTYVQAGIIDAKLPAATTDDDPVEVSTEVDKDGHFFMFVDGTKTASVAAANASFTTDTLDTYELSSAISYKVDNISDVSLKMTNYSSVKGSLRLDNVTGTNLKFIAGKEIVVDGAKTFGSLATFTPTSVADGSYNFIFMAETGKQITFSVEGADLTGSVTVVPGTDTQVNKIYMSTQIVSFPVNDANDNPIAGLAGVTLAMANSAGTLVNVTTTGTDGAMVWDSDDKEYKATIRADIDTSDLKVYITDAGYTFANKDADTAAAFTTSGYESTDGAYYLQFKKANGVAIAATAGNSTVKVYKAVAYLNTAGATVYDYTTAEELTLVAADKITAGNVYYKFIADATNMAKTSSSITTTKTDVLIAIPGTDQTTGNLFKKVYLLTADSKDNVIITAFRDSFSGKLTRMDGVTPIAGIKVDLGKSNVATAVDTTYTQEDGSFTLYSNIAIEYTTTAADVWKLKFHDTDYTLFTQPTTSADVGYTVYYDETTKNSVFKSISDEYTAIFFDADEMPIAATEYATATVGDSQVSTEEGTFGKFTAAFTDETGRVSIELKDGNNNKVRSFKSYSLTSDDLASGVLTLVSNQKTYTFTTVDADEKVYGGATIQMYKYVGDQDVKIDGETVAINNDPDDIYYGTGSILLPLVSEKDVSTVYGYRASGGAYVYDLATTKIDDTTILVESYSSTIKISIKDEAGKALSTNTPQSVTVYDIDCKQYAVTGAVTKAKGYFTFVGDAEATYLYKVTLENNYTITDYSVAVDGVLMANEQKVYGTLVDANGVPLPLKGNVTIQAKDANEEATGTQATYTPTSSNFSLTVSTAKAAKYVATFANDDDKNLYGTTISSKTLPIKTAAEFVSFSAITANGVELENAVITGLSAYDANESKTGKTYVDDDGVEHLFVETAKVVYYKAAEIIDGSDFVFTFDGESALNVFVANESYITGSVPYSGKGTGKVVLDLYLLDNLVKEIPGFIVDGNKYEYEAIIDMSDYIPVDGVAGMPFDSIIAVYSEGGVVIAASPVNPYTTVNNVISPTIESFEIKLDAPSALVARHVSMARVGNTATVSADAKFIVSDDEAIYTDGQYIYTFAGWYVDNELVSHNAVFTFTATEDVVIAPAYTVAYEKISDANAQVDPEIIIEEITKENTGIDTNVLIIGIAAVIVALIAVVYAVIKKE